MLRKKWMSAALASTLTLAMVLGGAGCGGAKDAKDKKSDEASTEKVQKKDKKDGEKVELKFLTYNGIKDADGNYLYQKQIDAYEKENPNVTITLDFQAENNSMDFLKKLDLMQLSGDTADIIQVSAYRDMADRAAQDFFAPLDDNLKEEGIKYEDKYDYPSEINGKHYAIPYNAGLYHVLINEDMMKEAGLSAPKAGWTWEDYRDYANKLTKGDGADKVYGSFMHTWTEYRREGLFNSKMDNPYTKEDGSSDLDNPDLKDWLTFINDMENKDKCQTPYSDAFLCFLL